MEIGSRYSLGRFNMIKKIIRIKNQSSFDKIDPLSDDRKKDIEDLSKTLHGKYPFVWSVDITIMDKGSLFPLRDCSLSLFCEHLR